jgi:regulator of ribonuclease activity A
VQFTTADLCDGYPDQVRLVEPLFRNYGGMGSFSGAVETVQSYEDNTLMRSALDREGNGRVLVVDGGASLRCALLGDQLARLAAQRGWSGVLINGCVRDSVELARIPLGIRALNTAPFRSSKAGRGNVGGTFSFGGVEFTPGKVLYADADGILLADQRLI